LEGEGEKFFTPFRFKGITNIFVLNGYIKRMRKEFPDIIIIPCSADAEIALREAAKKGMVKYVPGDSDFHVTENAALTPQQSGALRFIKSNVLDKYGSTGVQQVLNAAVFELLKYFAAWPVENATKLSDKKGNVLGLARVRDVRFDRLVEIYAPRQETPAQIEFSFSPIWTVTRTLRAPTTRTPAGTLRATSRVTVSRTP
jgi:hypothetical protein